MASFITRAVHFVSFWGILPLFTLLKRQLRRSARFQPFIWFSCCYLPARLFRNFTLKLTNKIQREVREMVVHNKNWQMARLRVLFSDRARSFNQWQRALYLNFTKAARNVRRTRVVCFFLFGFNLFILLLSLFDWLLLSPKAINEEECLVYTEIGYPVNPSNDSSLVAIPSACLSTNKRKKKLLRRK